LYGLPSAAFALPQPALASVKVAEAIAFRSNREQ
jgi:hypothetical protein